MAISKKSLFAQAKRENYRLEVYPGDKFGDCRWKFKIEDNKVEGAKSLWHVKKAMLAFEWGFR